MVLAFSLVQAQGNLRAVQKTVNMEALQLNQLDRLAISYGPDLTAVRQTAHDYAQSVVSDEWPRLAKHGYSPRSTELFRMLSQRVLSIQPTATRENIIYGDLVRMTDQLAESRELRLAESDLALPPIFWEVIGSLTILLIIFAGFVNARHAMSLGGLGAGVALLIALVFIFDQPFLGDSSVRPTAIVNVIQIMNARCRLLGSPERLIACLGRSVDCRSVGCRDIALYGETLCGIRNEGVRRFAASALIGAPRYLVIG